MQQCIYCSTNKDLNTQLTITLDNGNRYTVDICDEHAEEASIKSAKAAYLAKQDKIQIILEQAKALGLNISETGAGLVIAEQKPTPTPTPPPKPAHKTQIPETDDGFISTDMIDNRNRSMSSMGGNTQMGSVESHQSYDTSQARGALPDDALKGRVKMTVVEGREGQPLSLPQQRIDGTGTTRINVIKSETDQKLQERFKKMAQSSMGGQAPDFARDGYRNTTSTCPICRGDGVVNMGKSSQTCPKCNGSGIISTY